MNPLEAQLGYPFGDTEPKSAVDIVPLMFKRQLDAHQPSFAIGEALAHLHYLWYNGNLIRVTGDDGVIRYWLP
jgi:hypothetical protein